MDLGRYGIWIRKQDVTSDFARQVEELGFGTLWVGASPGGDLAEIEALLAATDRIVVATGVVNMWATPATQAAAAHHRLADRFGERFLLGVGIGHRESTAEYRTPYSTIVDYLDELDQAGVPASGRVLAALGPRVLRLSGERAVGAHPYFTTPEHTRLARETLGFGPLLAPEQKVVLETDPQRARELARPTAAYYLERVNYRKNLQRLGWSDADVTGGGSDALIDSLVRHGDADVLAAGLNEHLAAGADHVCAQILTPDGDAAPKARLAGIRAVAEALGLPG